MFHKTGLSDGQKRDEYRLADGFRELGHNVYTNDESKVSEVDLILCFKSDTFNKNNVLKWKSQTTAPIWMWTFDNIDRFPNYYDTIRECDLWLGEELGRAERFREWGIPFYYFPNHSADKESFHPIDTPKIYDVMFSGTPYFQERINMLRAVEEAGIDLHIFGNNVDGWTKNGFKNVHGPAFDENLATAVSQSKIVLGINSYKCYGMYSIRPAQVMLCGGFMIDQYSLGMERELRDGIEYWQTHEELIEKIKYYLEHEEERNTIAKRGYEIATTTLTSKSRCGELIKLFENYKKFGERT